MFKVTACSQLLINVGDIKKTSETFADERRHLAEL